MKCHARHTYKKRPSSIQSLVFLNQGTCKSICGHANCSHQCAQHQHFPCLPLKADVLYLINIRISRSLIDSSIKYCTIFFVACKVSACANGDILICKKLPCTLLKARTPVQWHQWRWLLVKSALVLEYNCQQLVREQPDKRASPAPTVPTLEC